MKCQTTDATMVRTATELKLHQSQVEEAVLVLLSGQGL